VLYVAALRLAPLSLVQAASRGRDRRARAARLARRHGAVALGAGGRRRLARRARAPRPLARGREDADRPRPRDRGRALDGGLRGGGADRGLPASRFLAAGAGLGAAAGILYAAATWAPRRRSSAASGSGSSPRSSRATALAFVALQLGFQRGSALSTAGVATVLTNALPIVAGMALFAESLPGGALGAVRVLSFAAVVAGAGLLARPEAPAGPPPVEEGAEPLLPLGAGPPLGDAADGVRPVGPLQD